MPRTQEQRAAFARELKASSERVAIFSPDDNWSLRFRADLEAAGVDCPGQVGLLTGIGTNAVRGERPLSTLVVDFERMGELAVDCLRAEKAQQQTVPVKLEVGVTT
jgi:DNA-binding LacI/PurR family transcriptional regulator